MWSPFGHVLAEFFPLAVGVAISSTPLIAVLVIALGRSGAVRGAALVLGRFLGIVVVVGAFAAASELFVDLRGSDVALHVVTAVVGVGMMTIGVITWVKRPRGAIAGTPPKWLTSLTRVSAPNAFGLGFALATANVKELALGAGAGVVIGGSLTEPPPTIAAVALFAAIGIVTVSVPVVAVAVSGERIRPRLDRIRAALERSSRTITCVVLVLFGSVLVGNSFL
ncbi:GAP family protein [Leifsonia shinshuensis]|uniref:Cytochrome c biogenesis protein CcdA n=1 Tax=Leifsonia shinshuensis TaxID=150026 RepID=A0A853CQ18_9MICO|nr:GAP family protein [Leifsonia shinshuensis]NYJ22358.1 cytochrome c biogenesis protein CcdA [Leifsonia shinshuensis]